VCGCVCVCVCGWVGGFQTTPILASAVSCVALEDGGVIQRTAQLTRSAEVKAS
jgi:hypothetical protein